MIFQGIIFDLDGVICSTDEYHYQAWKELADQEGIPFDRSVNQPFAGRFQDGEFGDPSGAGKTLLLPGRKRENGCG